MSDSPDSPPRANGTDTDPTPPSSPAEISAPKKKKGRWIDALLFLIGFVCLGTFAYQTVRYYRAKSDQPTGEIMSGLDEADRFPLDPGAAKDFNVLIITMDTTRADHLGCYGNRAIETPNIDNLARHGVLMSKAFTPSPSTLPSHSSILTGLYPYHHGARANGTFRLGPDQLTLAEILKEHGYTTGAVVSSYVLDSRFGLDQGFDVYDDDLTKGVKYGDHTFRERPAELANQAACEWLDANAASKFFLWVHFWDPHAPYLPPEPFRSRYQKQLYDGEIAYVDQQIGQLVAKLEKLGVRDNTVIVLTGDHGEGLGEHGEQTHSLLVYDATLHIPLIVSAPGLFDKGSVLRSQVCNVDIVPTILDLLAVSTDHDFDGVSLVRGEERQRPGIYFETICTLVLHGWSPLFGIRHLDRKYIHAPTPEFYDLANDPKELHNLFENADRAEDVVALNQELDQHIGQDRFGEAALAQAVSMDAETAEKLAALGYVGTKTGTVDVQEAAKLDPKEMVVHFQVVEHANNLISAGKIHEGVEALEAALEQVPNDVFTMSCLSGAYVKLGKLDKALEMALRALEHDTHDAGTCVAVARIYLAQHKLPEAQEMLEQAKAADPNCAGVYAGLGSLAAARGQAEEAEKYFRQAIEMDPGTTGPDAYAQMGQMYSQLMRYDEARAAYEKAIELDAFNAYARAGLGNLLVEEGDLDGAAEQFQTALRFDPNHVVVWANMAALYDKKHEYDKAREFAERALAINERSTAALNNLALIMKHTGDIDKAMELFNRALEYEPAFLACRLNLAQCYLARREEEKAVEQYEELLAYNPRVPMALANLGTYHVNHGRPEEAMQYFARAIRANPNYALAHAHYGALLLQMGDPQRALLHLKKSLELEPDQQGHENLEYQIRQLEPLFQASTQPASDKQPESNGP